MNNMPEYSFSEAKPLIKEGDILLFRSGSFPSAGWWITGLSGGIHSHVGIASISSGDLTIIEQKEFKGGREVILKSQVKGNIIDVYRVPPEVTVYENGEWIKKYFTDDVAHAVTSEARKVTGTPYNWYNIFSIYGDYLPGYRMIFRTKNGVDEISFAKICSQLLSYCFRKAYTDLVPNLRDVKTKPNDIACSALAFPMFTINDGKTD
jgi:hypothetical protein